MKMATDDYFPRKIKLEDLAKNNYKIPNIWVTLTLF